MTVLRVRVAIRAEEATRIFAIVCPLKHQVLDARDGTPTVRIVPIGQDVRYGPANSESFALGISACSANISLNQRPIKISRSALHFVEKPWAMQHCLGTKHSFNTKTCFTTRTVVQVRKLWLRDARTHITGNPSRLVAVNGGITDRCYSSVLRRIYRQRCSRGFGNEEYGQTNDDVGGGAHGDSVWHLQRGCDELKPTVVRRLARRQKLLMWAFWVRISLGEPSYHLIDIQQDKASPSSPR